MVLRSVFHGKLLDDIADDGGEGEGVRVIEFVVSFGSGRGVGGTRGRCAGRERRIDGRLRAKISIHSLAFCAPSGVTADTGVVVVVPVIVVPVVVVVVVIIIVSVIVVVVVVSTTTSSATGVVRVRRILAVGRRLVLLLLLIVIVLVPTIRCGWHRRRCLRFPSTR